MYPGFTDSHVHVLGVGQRERQLNLDDVDSVATLRERVAAAVAGAAPGEVVFGRGWIETHWPEGRFPERGDLDPVSPDNPVILVRADGHALVANSAALEAAGIDRDSEAPEGGEILSDAAGEPNGMLIDTAMGAALALVAQPCGEERADVYAEGAARLASLGWTGAHDMSVPYSDVAMIEDLAAQDRLPIRVYVSVNPDGYADLAREVPRVADGGRVITRAVKLYMDGALGSRGAALLEPYSDRPETSGLRIAEADETISIMTQALRDGVQMNVHAIGDLGQSLPARLGRGGAGASAARGPRAGGPPLARRAQPDRPPRRHAPFRRTGRDRLGPAFPRYRRPAFRAGPAGRGPGSRAPMPGRAFWMRARA